jgi:hypothetical protein
MVAVFLSGRNGTVHRAAANDIDFRVLAEGLISEKSRGDRI